VNAWALVELHRNRRWRFGRVWLYYVVIVAAPRYEGTAVELGLN
jgi:hypothetical protein